MARNTIIFIFLVFFVAGSIAPVLAEMYIWYDAQHTVHMTNVKPDWWTDDMDQKDPKDIHPPAENASQKKGRFIGDKSRKIVHLPSCPKIMDSEGNFKIKKEDIIWFDSLDKALSKGYKLCDECKPSRKQSKNKTEG